MSLSAPDQREHGRSIDPGEREDGETQAVGGRGRLGAELYRTHAGRYSTTYCSRGRKRLQTLRRVNLSFLSAVVLCVLGCVPMSEGSGRYIRERDPGERVDYMCRSLCCPAFLLISLVPPRSCALAINRHIIPGAVDRIFNPSRRRNSTGSHFIAFACTSASANWRGKCPISSSWLRSKPLNRMMSQTRTNRGPCWETRTHVAMPHPVSEMTPKSPPTAASSPTHRYLLR